MVVLLRKFRAGGAGAAMLGLLLSLPPGRAPAAPARVAASVPLVPFNWRSVVIKGMGTVTGFSVSPIAPFDLFVRTDVGLSYRYDRVRDRWVPLMQKFPRATAGGVESLLASPVQRGVVYAAMQGIAGTDTYGNSYSFGGEVYISRDNGLNWTPTGLAGQGIVIGPNSDYRAETGERIAVDPVNPDILYFATRANGLWRRPGATAAWEQVSGGLPPLAAQTGYTAQLTAKNNGQGYDFTRLPGMTFVLFARNATAAARSQTIYLGIHGAGVWRSTDAGASWSSLPPSGTQPLNASLGADGTLYVTFEGSNGQTAAVQAFRNGAWTDISPAGSQNYRSVSADRAIPGLVVANSDKRIWRRDPATGAWAEHNLIITPAQGNTSAPRYYSAFGDYITKTLLDPAVPNRVWAQNGFGVLRTEDITTPTASWDWHMNNLEELVVNQVRVPPQPIGKGGALLFSAVDDMIGFRHVSLSAAPTAHINPTGIVIPPEWRWIYAGNPTTYPQPFPDVAGAISMDYAYAKPNNMVFVGQHQWQYGPSLAATSTDSGNTWQGFPTRPSEQHWYESDGQYHTEYAFGGQVAMSPTNPLNIVWSPARGTHAIYTTDGGKTWNTTYNIDHDPAPDPIDPHNNDQVYYAALPRGWANGISPWISTNILTADRADPQGKTFYYYDSFNFFVSTDGGANWRRTQTPGTGIPYWRVHQTVLSNPARKGDIWIASARNDSDVHPAPLVRSTDGGMHFSKVGSVDGAEYIAFGKGLSADNPAIYILGRVGGATEDAMYRSTDGGASWVQISNPTLQSFGLATSIEADMRKANVVYVSTNGRGVMVGTN